MRAETITATQGIPVARRVPARPWVGTSRTADPHRAAPAAAPDPEVPAKVSRRQCAADDTRRILKRADACTEPGSLGGLLRQEGLYSSSLTAWRRQRDAGTLSAMTLKKRGRKETGRDARLTMRLRHTTLIVDVQKTFRRC